MIVGYIIEIGQLIDGKWFKNETRVDSIEEVQQFFMDNPHSYSIRLRVLKKFDNKN